jgi:hypothetical protein
LFCIPFYRTLILLLRLLLLRLLFLRLLRLLLLRLLLLRGIYRPILQIYVMRTLNIYRNPVSLEVYSEQVQFPFGRSTYMSRRE